MAATTSNLLEISNQFRKSRANSYKLLVVGVTYGIFGYRLFRLVWKDAVNLFFWDQWDYNDATLFQKHSFWQIFRWQHGPHRQGLGGILSKLLEPLTRWNSRNEAFAIWAIIVIASICALYLKRRLYGSLSLSDVIIPLIFFTPMQYEVLGGAGNPSHGPLPLLLMILYGLAWSIERQTWRYAVVLVINFLMIYTGFGIFVGFITPLWLLLEYVKSIRGEVGVRQWGAFVAFLVSIASIVSFFIGYKFQPAVDCFSPRIENPLKYAGFMSLMFADFLNVKGAQIVPFVIGGLILFWILFSLSISLTTVLTNREAYGTKCIAVSSLLTYCVLFCLSTALGRLCLGIEAAQSSRYMPYLILAFLGLYFAALSIQTIIVRRTLILLLLLVGLFSSIHLNKYDWLIMRGQSTDKRAWKECYFRTHEIEKCEPATGFSIYPNPTATRLQEKLDYLEKNHLNLFLDKD